MHPQRNRLLDPKLVMLIQCNENPNQCAGQTLWEVYPAQLHVRKSGVKCVLPLVVAAHAPPQKLIIMFYYCIILLTFAIIIVYSSPCLSQHLVRNP